MYLRKLSISNVRTIDQFDLTFDKDAEAGWHVILGQNGTGKSSVVRSFALLMMGEREASAAGQVFSEWLRQGEKKGEISAQVQWHESVDRLTAKGAPLTRLIHLHAAIAEDEEDLIVGSEVTISFSGERHLRSVWGGGAGWFSASFGPFRRFTGGDAARERAFLSNPRLAPHLSALTESVALTEAQRWLKDLHVQSLQDQRNNVESKASKISEAVISFLNESAFFPHGARIVEIRNDGVFLEDGNGSYVSMDAMSDGYRSALSLTLELIRLMYNLYGHEQMLSFLSEKPGSVSAPGVVAIDEVDAHLHPTWQRDIGLWLTRCFPKIQFLVTTHSPIVCRAVSNPDGVISGSVWLLPRPGSEDKARRVEGPELEKLVFGDILDAYETELFGSHVIRSPSSEGRLKELSRLNNAEIERDLTAEEKRRLNELREAFPGSALELSAG